METQPQQPIKELGTYCCYKISGLKAKPPYSERVEKCRNCSGTLESTCDDYFPLYRTQESFRRGANACLVE